MLPGAMLTTMFMSIETGLEAGTYTGPWSSLLSLPTSRSTEMRHQNSTESLHAPTCAQRSLQSSCRGDLLEPACPGFLACFAKATRVNLWVDISSKNYWTRRLRTQRNDFVPLSPVVQSLMTHVNITVLAAFDVKMVQMFRSLLPQLIRLNLNILIRLNLNIRASLIFDLLNIHLFRRPGATTTFLFI